MSNRIFQSVIVQLKDATDRVLGVIDSEGIVVSCSDSSMPVSYTHLVIPYVVAGVLKGRVEAGIDPQGVTAETLDISQFGGHAVNIANAVCIGVHKALGVDFVKYGVVKPGCCHSRSLPFVIDILGLQPKTILAYGWAKICPGGKFFEKRSRTGSVGTGPVSK